MEFWIEVESVVAKGAVVVGFKFVLPPLRIVRIISLHNNLLGVKITPDMLWLETKGATDWAARLDDTHDLNLK